MPELPDVEGFRRELAGPLPGRRIRQVTVHDPGILRNVGAQSLARKLRGVWLADDDITEVTARRTLMR